MRSTDDSERRRCSTGHRRLAGRPAPFVARSLGLRQSPLRNVCLRGRAELQSFAGRVAMRLPRCCCQRLTAHGLERATATAPQDRPGVVAAPRAPASPQAPRVQSFKPTRASVSRAARARPAAAGATRLWRDRTPLPAVSQRARPGDRRRVPTFSGGRPRGRGTTSSSGGWPTRIGRSRSVCPSAGGPEQIIREGTAAATRPADA